MVKLKGYDVLGILGKGSYGTCYKVKRQHDQAIHVLKEVSLTGLNSKDREDTLNEARILAGLPNHPNICQYWASWCEADKLYILMDFYADGDLSGLIRASRGLVPEPSLIGYLTHIARGLKFLHQNRILHR